MKPLNLALKCSCHFPINNFAFLKTASKPKPFEQFFTSLNKHNF